MRQCERDFGANCRSTSSVIQDAGKPPWWKKEAATIEKAREIVRERMREWRGQKKRLLSWSCPCSSCSGQALSSSLPPVGREEQE